MRSFIKNIVLFSFLFSALVGIMFLSQSYFLKKGNYYSLPEGTDAIILGHSHASCAYNDSLIDGVVNLAEPMEGYFYSYFKLKQILRHNKLKYVFVEYSNNQLSIHADDRIFGQYMPNQLPKMMPFVDTKSLVKIAAKSPVQFLRAIPVSFKMSFDFYTKGERDYINRFWSDDKISPHIMHDSLKVTKKSLINDASKNGFIKNTYSASEMNLHYLAQIALLCEQNGVKLYYLRAPVSKYHSVGMESMLQDLLKHEFPSVQFIDLKDFPLKDDDFADPQHINISGAKKISIYLNTLINEVIRSEEMTINQFINQNQYRAF